MLDERNPELVQYTCRMAARCREARDLHGGKSIPAWSPGERCIVALVLHDPAALATLGYTEQEARDLIAGDLGYYGYPGSVGDWLSEVREALGAAPAESRPRLRGSDDA